MKAQEWQREWQEGMERDKNGVCACRQVVLIGELAEMERELVEAQRALQEVHRLAHERPTKNILLVIHQLTEPWHKH